MSNFRIDFVDHGFCERCVQTEPEQGLKTFEEIEREYIPRVLEAKSWKIGGDNCAASTLGMHVNTLRGRMKKFGIRRP